MIDTLVATDTVATDTVAKDWRLLWNESECFLLFLFSISLRRTRCIPFMSTHSVIILMSHMYLEIEKHTEVERESID